jgi:hypothetical protein
LGAVVEAYDVRAAAGEQVRSLGAKFLEVDLGGIQTEDKGGYAVELSEEALKRGRDLIAAQAKSADVIITTAQVPGRRAPVLMDETGGEWNEARLGRNRSGRRDGWQRHVEQGGRGRRPKRRDDHGADKLAGDCAGACEPTLLTQRDRRF